MAWERNHYPAPIRIHNASGQGIYIDPYTGNILPDMFPSPATPLKDAFDMFTEEEKQRNLLAQVAEQKERDDEAQRIFKKKKLDAQIGELIGCFDKAVDATNMNIYRWQMAYGTSHSKDIKADQVRSTFNTHFSGEMRDLANRTKPDGASWRYTHATFDNYTIKDFCGAVQQIWTTDGGITNVIVRAAKPRASSADLIEALAKHAQSVDYKSKLIRNEGGELNPMVSTAESPWGFDNIDFPEQRVVARDMALKLSSAKIINCFAKENKSAEKLSSETNNPYLCSEALDKLDKFTF